MDRLHDDAIKSIGQYAGILYGGTAYIYFAQTCKRMKQLLLPVVESNTSSNNQTIKNIIFKRLSHHLSILQCSQKNQPISTIICTNPNSYNIHTLQQLSIFESWLSQTNFVHDNRKPFPFASTEIEPDMQRQIDTIANFMVDMSRRHNSSSGVNNNLMVRLDAHCGTAAPSGIDSWFSRARGLSVRYAVYEKFASIRHENRSDDMDDNERDNNSEEEDDDDDHGHNIKLVSWGKRIASIVEQLTDHPFRTLAGEGRGWVEVYFIVPATSGEDEENDSVEAMVLPPRHGYYFNNDGRSINNTEMDEEDERLADIIIDFNQQHAHMFE